MTLRQPAVLVQPADETPLPGTTSPVVPSVIAAAPGIAQDLALAHDDALAAVAATIAQVDQDLDQAHAGVVDAVKGTAAALDAAMFAPYRAIRTDVAKRVGGLDQALEDAYTGLWQEGVQTPLGLMEMGDDLVDGGGTAMKDRFVPAIQEQPQPAVQIEPVPPPVSQFDTSASLDANGRPYCPEGYDLYQYTDRQWYCRLASVPPTLSPPPPPSVPPVIRPPSVPPVIGPPISPPPPPIVIGPPIGPPGTVPACDAGDVVTTQVACFQLPAPTVQLVYYITLDCSDCHAPKACVWKGVKPPEHFTGVLVPGTWTTAPTQADLEALVKACAVPRPSPPSPPPSPPSSPPSPPAILPPIRCPTTPQTLADQLTTPRAPQCVTGPPVDDNDLDAGLDNHTWDQIASCTAIHDQVIECLERPTNEACGRELPIAPKSTWESVGAAASWFLSPITPIVSLIVGKDTTEKQATYKTIAAEMYQDGQRIITEVIGGLTGNAVSNAKAAATLGTVLGIAHRTEQLTGFPLSYLMTSVEYMYHYANPQFIPSQGELNRMYLSNRINDKQWQCYTKANGNIAELARVARDAGDARPNTNDLISLYRRGYLTSQDNLVKRCRENGVLKKDHVDEWLKLSEWQPQPPDLIRFMVRDVFDETVVDKYRLDDEFKQKYPASAEKLGTAVGLTQDTAKLEWMAHWRVPSDTALYTMVQRLRADRPAVIEWNRLALAVGPQEATRRLGPPPPVFTVEDLKYALKINDNLPSFVDALVDISYRPITNTDASRMYEIGLIDDAEFTQRVMNNGYTRADADQTVRFYKAQKLKRVSNSSGVWTTRKIVAAFKGGLIDRQKADSLLSDIIVDAGTRTKVLDGAQFEQKIAVLAARVKSLKKRYLFGEFSTNDLTQFLSQVGMDLPAIEPLALQWEAERTGRTKEPRVTMLCEWRDRGLITANDHYERLLRLGYTPQDAERISVTCAANLTAKHQRAAAAAAEKQYSQTRRAMRDTKEDLAGKIKQLEQQLQERQQELADANRALGY